MYGVTHDHEGNPMVVEIPEVDGVVSYDAFESVWPTEAEATRAVYEELSDPDQRVWDYLDGNM